MPLRSRDVPNEVADSSKISTCPQLKRERLPILPTAVALAFALGKISCNVWPVHVGIEARGSIAGSVWAASRGVR